MFNKILYSLLIILFFSLPLINSHLIDLLGIKWGFYVDGNYEFTKVIFFNIFSSLIISLYFIKNILFKEKIHFPKILVLIIGILLISTYYSDFFYTSLLGNTFKGHNLIMYLNLISLYIIFINQKKSINENLINTLLYSSVIISLIGIKEYFIPTFDYGNLSNRAFSTFGHPNYLAGYILLLLPFAIKRYKNIFIKIIIFLLIILLFLSKSIWGLIVFFSYLIFQSFYHGTSFLNTKKRKLLFLSIIFFIIIILGIMIIKFGLITKLNSFISRFYIWETTLKIIISNPFHLIIGNGIATLDLIFNSFKSPELYIFENIGFTSDRPHNIILNIFYHFGLLGLSLFSYLIYNFLNNYKNNKYYLSIILFLIFNVFNFGGITHYLILTLIFGIIYKKNNVLKNIIFSKVIFFLLLLFSIFGSIFSYNYYRTEFLLFNNKNINLNNYNYILINKINSEKNKNNESLYGVNDYFYLGNLYSEIGLNKKANYYYKKGLNLLPDMRNINSIYYNNFFIKKLFVPERFYSKKFSNLKEILKRVGISYN